MRVINEARTAPAITRGVETLCRELVASTSYRPQLQAVPFDRAVSQSRYRMEMALRHHPEKQCLAHRMLHVGVSTLEPTAPRRLLLHAPPTAAPARPHSLPPRAHGTPSLG